MRTIAAALTILAMCAADAHGAPAVLGDGADPAVAVDGAGTAHVVWRNANGSTLTYCRLPRGAGACVATTPVATSGQIATRFYVASDGTTVRIVAGLYDKPQAPTVSVDVFTSTDGGQSFGAGTAISTIRSLRDVAFGPGDAASLIGISPAGDAMGVAPGPFDGSASSEFAPLAGDPFVHAAAVGLAGGTTPVAVFADRGAPGKAQTRHYDGSGPTGDPANWTAPIDLGEADSPELAGGPSGLFLLSRAARGLNVRKFDGTTFGAAAPLPDGVSTSDLDLAQDAGGRLHAVWARNAGDGTHLEHATSDDGATWRTGSLVVGGEAFTRPRVAVAPDHLGVAVWTFSGKVRMQLTGPEAPVAPAPPPPPEPAPIAKPVVVPAYSGAIRQMRRKTRFGTWVLRLPRDCVRPTQRFKVTFRWTPRRRAYRLRRVEFRFGAQRVKADRKAPYAALYPAPTRAISTVRVLAHRKARGGRPLPFTSRASIRRCA